MLNRSKNRIIIFSVFGICVIAIALLWWFNSKKKQAHQKQPISVIVQKAVIKSIPIDLKLPGKIEAVESVSVRSQATGILKIINFQPGGDVKKGQLLFELEPDSFLADLEQAKANLERDQAQYEETKRNEERLSILVKNNFVSKQAYGQAQSQMAMQKATIAADREIVKAAQLKLSYTKILSPIDGKSGNVTVKIGDLITSAGAAPLVTINKINPVYANFDLPQRRLPELLAYQRKNPIDVEVWTEDHSHLLGKGRLVFIDNTVNTDTGTVLLKALIPNDKLLLWPSQLVLVKLIFTIQPDAVVVPSTAVRSDDEGRFVYKAQNAKAVITRVSVEKQLGKWTVIKSGLKAGDLVITTPPPELQSDSAITIKTE